MKQETENMWTRLKREIKPIYTTGAGTDLIVYYSEKAHLLLTTMVQACVRAIREAKIPGVIEAQVGQSSLQVMFDPWRIRFEDVVKEVKKIEEELMDPEMWSTDTRLFEIPVWFDDPWSKECYLAHKGLHQIKDGSMSNFEYVTRLNGWSNKEFAEKLCAFLYLEFSTGFIWSIQGWVIVEAEEEAFPTAPKWPVSRPWTPARTLGIAGADVPIYPFRAPGGYQMIGSTPVPISALELPPDERKPARIPPVLKEYDSLMRVGDLMRLVSIGKEEYEEIRARVVEGTYEYKVKAVRWEPKKWIDDPKGHIRTLIS